MKTNPDKQFLDTMSKEPGNWKGPIYYNRKDPRLMVPKLNPFMGWTFNFASPYAYITLGAIIIIVIAASTLAR